MFTGIIQTMGEVVKVDTDRGDPRFYIRTDLDLNAVPMGASVCHAGCCLTVVEKDGDVFATDVSAETLSKTTLGSWGTGTKINLEPSLKVGDELGGHIVSGHVDGVATIIAIEKEGDSRRLTIEAPEDLAKFIAPKGSITLDGISLTVNEVSGNQFGINIIPHTWEITTLGLRNVGDTLNIEIDLMARYAARLMEYTS
ncbi:MAG: riboflavin synthase [Alphaproteobacteria bacterium]|nr:MAG: riboflavin synthase [Alphaproteobacteria bacterium]